MFKKIIGSYFVSLFLFSFSAKAQLIINEVSQGYSGNQEYVELIVVGTPTCNAIPCMDLRGYYIDDNNGNHATGAGVGIAQGCVRFTTNALWSCVPVGTIILIYNDADLNPDVPAQDLSLTDGNCKLVIPISNCTLFEKNTSTPSTAVATYPTTGFSACGSWGNISMANGDDSFQSIDPSGNQVFSVSWGNNNVADIIYFAAGQTGMVCSMTNSADNNPGNQSNWTSLAVAGNQTPGSPNNAANAAWINSMNNSCTALTPLMVSSSITNAGCTCTGSATVTASGAIGPYTYSWAPSGGTASSASGLCPGNYTVTVTSSNGCVQTTTLTIVSISPITTSVSATNVSCNGGSNGSATVTVNNTTGAVTYSWSPAGGSAATGTGLSAGNYTVNISDGAGCTATQTVTITEPPALTITPTQTNVLCNGGNTGTASVTVSGGTGAYTYTWAPSGGNSSSATNLSAGNYTCTVNDANGCSKTQSFIISEPNALAAVPTQTNVTCNGGANGSAAVSVSGGTGAYSYTWSPSGGNSSSASGLAQGNYTVQITDANACSLSQSFSIAAPSAITITPTQTNVTCNGGTNGSASVAVSGGTGAYTYSWMPSGGNSASANGLSQGNYTATVSDANGCIKTQNFLITAPTPIVITPTQTNVSCNGGANGIASVSVSGGTGSYTYSWSPSGGNSSSATNLQAGNYSAAVSDANGCNTVQNFTITEPPALNIIATQTNVSCNGGADGTANANISGGTGAYSYTWAPSGGNSSSAANLSSGNYTVNVTDANGCNATQNFSITQPPALTVTISNTPATCGTSNGTATTSVSGGTGAYTYTWSPAGGSAAAASGLAVGNYTASVSDANGCIATNTTSIINNGGAAVSVSSTSVSCNGGSDGTASATASGGVGSYTYSWSPIGGTSAVATNLPAGNYTIAVTDGAGCITISTITITQPSAITATLTPLNVSCFGGNNGSISAMAAGGAGAYSYTWTPSGGTAPIASGLTAGNYSVTITDANGCSLVSSTVVTQPNQLSITTTTLAVSCNGGSNGSCSANVTGGTAPYSYTWQPTGGNSSVANNLSAGDYTVIVTDNNGCVLSNVSTVPEPTPISISITNTQVTCNANNGTANGSASGGTAPYTYSWQPTGGASSTSTGLAPGIYTLIVTDNNNCIATDTTTITSASTMSLSVTSTSVSCNGGSTGSASVNVNGGPPPYTYTWAAGAGNSSIANNLAAGNYTVSVTDASGCTLTATTTVSEPPALTVAVTNTTICIGQNAILNANASGGTAPYQYSWNGGPMQASSTFTVSPNTATVYSVMVIDGNGCVSVTSTATVNVYPPLQVTIGDALICAGANANLIAIASGGNGNYSYSWMPGNLTGSSVSVTQQATTIYTVTVSDGCTTTNASDTGLVSVISVPTLTLLPTISGCVPLCINFTVSPSANIISFQWDFGDNNSVNAQNPQHCYTTAGVYNVSLTYSTTQGCVNTVTSNGMVNVFGKPHAAFAASVYETTMYEPQISFYNESTGAITWQWDFGDGNASIIQNPVHNYASPGDYMVYLSVTNQYGCKDSALVEIKVKENFSFFAPNAFTPDGDDLNESFLPRGIGWDTATYKLWIFDRWGNQVYTTPDPDRGWDGTRKGEAVQQDVYVWEVELKDVYGASHKYNGTVSLIR